LNTDGVLTAEQIASAPGGRTFAYDPTDPVPSLGGATLLHKPGVFDQRPVSNRPDVLKFATRPLDAPLEITGRVTVRLYVSTDATDTDFTAKLIDIYPDGREILMLDGIQRLKFRNTFERPEFLPPGEIAELEIDLWSISLIFNEGHRIGLHISSSNYPRFERNPNTGKDFPVEGEPLPVAHNTVYMGLRHPSALILPIRR
jgi:putative CocE/NonD family hydrolase